MIDINQNLLLYEYSNILVHNKKNYSDNYFTGTDEDNEEFAVDFIRLVTRMFLNCSSLKAAQATITMEMLEKMELKKIVQFIKIPKFVASEDRNSYVIDRIFTNNFDPEIWIANRMCEKINRGTMKKFPKFYMSYEEGDMRACYCLNYFLSNDQMMNLGIKEAYEFAATNQFKSYLKDHLLLNVCLKHFASPIEYLHQSLPEEKQNPFWNSYVQAMYDLKTDCENNNIKLQCAKKKVVKG